MTDIMTFEEFKTILCSAFPSVSEEQIEKFRAMESLYAEWNEKINVISRKDIGGLYSHHVLHSLAIAYYEPSLSGKILDVGTGGGFPGIPLAIMFPEAQFTLCDSIGKKTLVASSVADSLGLKNVSVVNARAESLPDNFDWVVSRAVTSLDNFLPWVKGKFEKKILYLKGGDISEEIAAAMKKMHLPKGSVGTWSIKNWLADEYFEGKFVISIEKF